MQAAAAALDFEAAALIRDRIRALSMVQGHQDIHVAGRGRRRCDRRAPGRRADLRPGVLFPRRAELGQPRLFPEPRPPAPGRGGADGSFVGQFYDNRPKPPLVLLSHALGRAGAGRRGAVARRRHGSRSRCRSAATRRSWSTASLATAREALGRRLAESASQRQLLDGVAAAFGLDGAAEPHRGLRQQPHPGHQRGRRDDRRRPRRADRRTPTASSRSAAWLYRRSR